MQEVWLVSVGSDLPWEKEMGTNSSVLAWKITWTEEAGGLRSVGLHKSWTLPIN